MERLDFEVTAAAADGAARIALGGELTIYTAAELRDRLVAVVPRAERIELDTAAVSEIDTAGLQVLLSVKRHCEGEGKSLVCAEHSDSVRECIELLRLADELGAGDTIAP